MGALRHRPLHCLAALGRFLLQRRVFCSVEERGILGQESRRATLWVIAFPGFAEKEELAEQEAMQPQGMPLRRGCRWRGASPLAGALCHGRQSPVGNIPPMLHGTEGRPPLPAGAAAAYPASGRD